MIALNLPHQMSDAGTYTLRGENRNGSDKVAGYYQKHHDHACHKGGLGPGGAGDGTRRRVRVAQVRKPGVPMQSKFQVVKMILSNDNQCGYHLTFNSQPQK